jgi:hypothetical protein
MQRPTFFMLAGKEWTVPVPHCPQCDLNEETIRGIPRPVGNRFRESLLE